MFLGLFALYLFMATFSKQDNLEKVAHVFKKLLLFRPKNCGSRIIRSGVDAPNKICNFYEKFNKKLKTAFFMNILIGLLYYV